MLSNITDEDLRMRASFARGWLLQPVESGVWNGEFQTVFFGDEPISAVRKSYRPPNTRNVIPSRAERHIEHVEPRPCDVDLGRRIRAHWEHGLGLPLGLYRLDVIDSAERGSLVLEFETVNPGFGEDLMDPPVATDLYRRISDRLFRSLALRKPIE